MSYLLGIDVSTTATKTLLINTAGDVVATASQGYDVSTPQPLWSEQDPALWWQGAVATIRAVLAESGVDPAAIGGVGLTGQMHGLVLLDEAGQVLRPAILWNDQRTAAECDEIRQRVGRAHLLEVTGNDALTGFTAPKLLWVRHHEPATYKRIAHVLLPKDYVRLRLSGEYAIDKADASGTLLLDLRARRWSDELLAALELSPTWFPTTYEGPAITGYLTAAAAEATGLRAGTPIIAGGGDQSAQAVGVGVVQNGIIALTLGTSGVVFACSDVPFVDPQARLQAFCHAVPGQWHLMGVMLAAAGSLRWYRDTLAPGSEYDALLAPAEQVAPGCEGLIFLPYLTGERTPHPDPLARGAFIGLTVRHTQAHMTRAVLEGVGFGLRDSFELLRQVGHSAPQQIRVSGGGARSPLWRQILADIFNQELVTVNTTEGAAFGAALLAGVGNGIWPTVAEACAQTVRITGRTAPNSERASHYNTVYEHYRTLYPTLQTIFRRLGAL